MENAFIDKNGKLRHFEPDEQLVDQELAKELIQYAYEQVCWNFSCLEPDDPNYYYQSEEFCYHELCLITLQMNRESHTLNKIMVRTPELIMVFQEPPQGVEFEIEELIDDAIQEYEENQDEEE